MTVSVALGPVMVTVNWPLFAGSAAAGSVAAMLTWAAAIGRFAANSDVVLVARLVAVAVRNSPGSTTAVTVVLKAMIPFGRPSRSPTPPSVRLTKPR